MAGLFTMAPPMAPTNTPQVTMSNGSTGVGQNFGAHGPPNSTLLFGFLVSFLALFIIFMIFGLGSRHYLDLRRRQRRLFENVEETSPSELSPPILWDVPITPGMKEKWDELMPLSVTVQHDAATPEALEALRARQTLSYLAQLSVPDRFFFSCGEFLQRTLVTLKNRFREGRRSHLEVASHTTQPQPKPNRDVTASPTKPVTESVNLQISVIVAMPIPQQRQHHHPQPQLQPQQNDMTKLTKEVHESKDLPDDHDGWLPDIAIGVTNVSWDQLEQRLDFG